MGEGKTEMVGDHTGDGMYKWSGGVYADGFIYGIPCNARRMFMIDGGGTHEVDIGRTERNFLIFWVCPDLLNTRDLTQHMTIVDMRLHVICYCTPETRAGTTQHTHNLPLLGG